MYTKAEVDDVLSQVEKEFEKALSIEKSEKIEEAIEDIKEEVNLIKSEDENSEDLDYTNEDYDTIDEIYSSMNKSEKEAHYNSIKKSLSENSEQEFEGEIEDKSEVVVEDSMIKSENEELKTQNEELKKSIGTMNELLDKMFNKTKKAPAQKAMTGYTVVEKSEGFAEEKDEVDFSTMTKGEITSKIKTVDQNTLTKSDRNAINDYYLNNGSVESIKHLIKE